MKLVALLSFYDESPAWLAATAASLTKLDVAHLVCLDGPYALFPDARDQPRSGPEQHEALLETCHGAGIGCTVHAPRKPWLSEVIKRNRLLQAGLLEKPEWLFWLDADELVTDAPSAVLVHEELAETTLDVASVSLWTREDPLIVREELGRMVDVPAGSTSPARRFLRAVPGLRIEQAHYLVLADPALPGTQAEVETSVESVDSVDSGRVLVGDPALHAEEPALDLGAIQLEHRTNLRDRNRRRRAGEYYALRDRVGIERQG